MNTHRDRCFKLFEWDTEKWKGLWCLNPKFWHELCDIFGSTDWQDLSKKNKKNRTGSGLEVAHYGGSASMHQHQKKLVSFTTFVLQNYYQSQITLQSDICPFLFFRCCVEKTLLNDTEPTKEQLYLHTHCKLPSGKSPVLAQIEASQTTKDSDTTSLVNESAIDGPANQDYPFDSSSYQFTNERAQKVYVSSNFLPNQQCVYLKSGVHCSVDFTYFQI